MEVKGRLPWSSNGTFLVDLCRPNGDGDEDVVSGVYKPAAGERALWDYPSGLFRRERAVYLVSEALGWGLVPETVLREGPLGVGSLQRFVSANFAEHYFTLLERPEHHDALRAIGLFDLLVNNGDRKSGHCLLGTDGRIWAI
ncbi:MAG TPA: phosphatidylinositol kinase, partial [Acidimicrobiales bacterium]|nr:phosphatidylinositol kinase [Acidimicrobiales bacterium]